MTIILSNLNSECYDEVEGKIFLKSRGLNELERQLYLRNKVLFDENAVRSTLESEVTDGQIMNHTPTRESPGRMSLAFSSQPLTTLISCLTH